MKTIMLFVFFLALPLLPVLAQVDPDKPNIQPVNYDDVVTETINDLAPYDWWQLQAIEGEIIVVDMTGEEGLAPLIGLLSPGGILVADTLEEQSAPNSKTTLEYTADESGMYTIIASRQGRLEGETTGSYTLQIRRANSTAERLNPFQDVTFRCADYEVTTVATIVFAEDTAQVEFYRITLLGLDDFDPIIRINVSQQDATDCSEDTQVMGGDVFMPPGGEPILLDEERLEHGAQLTIRSADQMGTVTLTIGSKNGTVGHYMAVIEGFQINPASDVDSVQFRLGPFARDSAMDVYMVGAVNTRLDPFIRIRSEVEGIEDVLCDDAGKRGCMNIPAFTGAGVRFNNGTDIIGDQFDAGVRLQPGHPDPITVEFGSREKDTHGAYTIVILGELPPRS